MKTGDKVTIIDASYAYLVTDKLEEYILYDRAGFHGWLVVATKVPLPSPSHGKLNINDTIIRKGDFIAFIHSGFLESVSCMCPTCGRPL